MIHFIITWLVTTVALVIITFLPTGVESDDFSKTAITALVIGVLNALVAPLRGVLNVLTLGLFFLFGNIILFGIAAKLVEGFRLRWGVWSAVIGAIALSLLNSILFRILAAVGVL